MKNVVLIEKPITDDFLERTKLIQFNSLEDAKTAMKDSYTVKRESLIEQMKSDYDTDEITKDDFIADELFETEAAVVISGDLGFVWKIYEFVD